MGATTFRAAGALTLAVAALLGSAYALGRSMVPEQPPRTTASTVHADGPRYADQPPDDSPTPHTDAPASPVPASPVPDQRPAGDGDGPYGAWMHTGTDRVALTFDDGPDPQYTPQVLDLLRSYGVKATFCVVGENAQNHPDLIEAIVAEGHTLCNHSWNHDTTLGKRSPESIRADLLRTNDAIRAAVPDARITWFRQPGGEWTYPVASICAELGMTPLHWAVDPADWQAPGAEKVTSAVLSDTGPGSIVLMHDAGGDRRGTVEALHRILPELVGRYQLEALPTNPT
ncbi:polysaccharide deacetylase family protein [Micromonospora sp. R77]|uniref:polysaccharide deacetylase family protein n=1 Tax=Micromonospora sp. R77 TaxID=2925836 RepID=UPI001F620BB9|nr:polysaccharide deacetylase family protein [Micromonospora sp. R77]MCI4062972.1 polysaccharide deacetylase family protein [Micromonospora sp. R77]